MSEEPQTTEPTADLLPVVQNTPAEERVRTEIFTTIPDYSVQHEGLDFSATGKSGFNEIAWQMATSAPESPETKTWIKTGEELGLKHDITESVSITLNHKDAIKTSEIANNKLETGYAVTTDEDGKANTEEVPVVKREILAEKWSSNVKLDFRLNTGPAATNLNEVVYSRLASLDSRLYDLHKDAKIRALHGGKDEYQIVLPSGNVIEVRTDNKGILFSTSLSDWEPSGTNNLKPEVNEHIQAFFDTVGLIAPLSDPENIKPNPLASNASQAEKEDQTNRINQLRQELNQVKSK